MAETWWTFAQAAEWVRAHRPCGSLFDAFGLVYCWVEDGGVPARYRRPDDRIVAVAPNEWRRDGNRLHWQGWEEQDHLKFGVGELEIEAAAVQRLCTPKAAPARKVGGRTPKHFVVQLAAFGGAWLAANGIPNTQTDMTRALQGECDRRGWEYGDTQVREMAAELIAAYQAEIQRDP